MLRTARCAPVKGMKAVEAIGMAAKERRRPICRGLHISTF